MSDALVHDVAMTWVSDNGVTFRYIYEVRGSEADGFTVSGYGCEILDGQAFNQFGEWDDKLPTKAEAIAVGEGFLDHIREADR